MNSRLLVPLVLILLQFAIATLTIFVEREQRSDHTVWRVQKFTLGRMMCLVAILTVTIWWSIEIIRSDRRGAFLIAAVNHSQSEIIEQACITRLLQDAAELERQAQDATAVRKQIAAHTARADHHAKMKHRYERAIARKAFSLEPDPPPSR